MSDLSHVAKVRATLQDASEPLSVPEIEDRAKLSERLVRISIGVLEAQGALEASRRYEKRRGAMPTVYTLKR